MAAPLLGPMVLKGEGEIDAECQWDWKRMGQRESTTGEDDP